MSVRSLRCNRIEGAAKKYRACRSQRSSGAAAQQVASNLWLVFGCANAMRPRGFSQRPAPPAPALTRSQTSRHSVNLNYLSVRADPLY